MKLCDKIYEKICLILGLLILIAFIYFHYEMEDIISGSVAQAESDMFKFKNSENKNISIAQIENCKKCFEDRLRDNYSLFYKLVTAFYIGTGIFIIVDNPPDIFDERKNFDENKAYLKCLEIHIL